MKALVLGIGLQGKAVVYDLDKSRLITEIIAADTDQAEVEQYLIGSGAKKAKAVSFDASDEGQLQQLISEINPDIVVCMLPASFGYAAANAAIDAGKPFVSTSYTGRIAELADKAKQKKVAVLPEMGLDPGIDLIMGKMAIEALDEIHGLYSYGSGVPEPPCADDNPLKYKITWTFDGVLLSYKRPARLLKDGKEISIAPKDIFNEENIHRVDMPGLGRMEAYPNGDAVSYIKGFGLTRSVMNMGRFAMRWPGHCEFWRIMSTMGFLDDQPVLIDGVDVSPFKFVSAHLSPRLQYRRDERDVVIVRVHAWGLKHGRPTDVICDLVDYRDLETGFFAMNRTVGFTASIAAQMLLDGTITETGLLSPIRHVPTQSLIDQLEQRNVTIQYREER
jgi:saccharopine dehydrogenase-like NADP-dependent oxidoreductase